MDSAHQQVRSGLVFSTNIDYDIGYEVTFAWLTGLSVALAAVSRIIYRGRSSGNSRNTLIIYSASQLGLFLLWLSSGLRVIISWQNLVCSAAGAFGDLTCISSYRVQIAATISEAILPLLADGIIIQRARILYPNKRWTLVPILPLLGAIICTFTSIIVVFRPGYNPVKEAVLANRFSYGTLSLSVITNAFTLAMVGWKLWNHRRFVKRFIITQPSGSTSSVENILSIMIESGVLYGIIQVVYLITLTTVGSVAVSGKITIPPMGVVYYSISGLYPTAVSVITTTQSRRAELARLVASDNNTSQQTGSNSYPLRDFQRAPGGVVVTSVTKVVRD